MPFQEEKGTHFFFGGRKGAQLFFEEKGRYCPEKGCVPFSVLGTGRNPGGG
jgi:hypothetical protein